MSGPKYVPQGAYLVCDKGAKPCTIRSFSHQNVEVYGDHMCTAVDKLFAVNFDGFGACAMCQGAPCTAPTTLWAPVTTNVLVGGKGLLLDNSVLPCALGGIIKIYFSGRSAYSALSLPPRSLSDKTEGALLSVVATLPSAIKGVGEGWLDALIWVGKHMPPYKWFDPDGYKEHIENDIETMVEIKDFASDAATWYYRNSIFNYYNDPADYNKARKETGKFIDDLILEVENMTAEEFAEHTTHFVVGFVLNPTKAFKKFKNGLNRKNNKESTKNSKSSSRAVDTSESTIEAEKLKSGDTGEVEYHAQASGSGVEGKELAKYDFRQSHPPPFVLKGDPGTPSERKIMAYNFYRNAGVSDGDAIRQIQGIDFNKPVEVVEIPKGVTMGQWQGPGRPQGNYFSNIDSRPEELGIASTVTDQRNANFKLRKIQTAYTSEKSTLALRSTASPTKDTWSHDLLGAETTVNESSSQFVMKGEPVDTEGGGIQYFVPDKNTFK